MLCEMNKLFSVIELSWNNFLIYDQDYIGVIACVIGIVETSWYES